MDSFIAKCLSPAVGEELCPGVQNSLLHDWEQPAEIGAPWLPDRCVSFLFHLGWEKAAFKCRFDLSSLSFLFSFSFFFFFLMLSWTLIPMETDTGHWACWFWTVSGGIQNVPPWGFQVWGRKRWLRTEEIRKWKTHVGWCLKWYFAHLRRVLTFARNFSARGPGA